VRRLIVNADDLGYTSGVNRAIFEAHSAGIVTSTTLMANGPAFADACAGLASLPRLAPGCHVVLTDGVPLSDASSIGSLMEPGSQEFRASLGQFAARAIFGAIDPRHVEAEAGAQIRRIQSAGISPSHIDTHKHTHLFPTVLRPILRAARECGVRAVRNPFSASRALPSSLLLKQPGIWIRWAELRALSRFEATFRHTALAHGFTTTDGTLGMEVTGVLDEAQFLAIAQNIPPGTWELVCHPGYNDGELARSHTRLKKSREVELRVLTSPESRSELEKAGVELISYRDLAR
jgi:chitin disaccharide deacetylase